MTSLLIGIVGRAPASIVVAARAFRPDRTLLVHSVGTRPVAEVVQRQLADHGLPRPELVAADPDRLDATAQAVTAALADVPDGTPLVVDLSGGTKPMSLGLWEGTRGLAASLPPGRRRAVYLNAAGALLDADTGEKVPEAEAVSIDPREVIAWARPEARVVASWAGTPEELDEAVRERAMVWQQLAKAITKGTWRSNVSRPQRRFQPHRAPATLPPGFAFKGNGMIEMPLEYLVQNGWLEELALAKVASAVKKLPGVRLALSATVTGRTSGNVELDLVATRGARTLVVEAKTMAGSPGQKLSRKASDVFSLLGPSARLLAFVPSVFGDGRAAQSRADMEANLGPNGKVCRSIAHLGALARAHLGS
ncbi:hypothetical protein [Aphanothece minutissima]|uniref:DUF1887 domain-containing protein n=1 Tax=Aphanothece cf. minutissima CCALA 015 TaxID=2107695 RepID=A0ABX5FC15_9CHRO|nr:hypothetical protein [Aphanothece minutissima]PSB39458.1 hypothetical protein C7B81_02115 [Aphanothece cf. minutissima CCALA 015]